MNTLSARRINIALEVIMLLLAAVMVVPIYYLLVTTLKTSAEAALHPLALPNHFMISGYIKAWQTMNYPRVFMNNVLITVTSVVGVILLASLAAYTFARRPNRINQILFYFILIGVTIPFQVATIPLFKLMKSFGLVDTFSAVILVNIFTMISFNVFLIKNFIATVPIELEESASIDGCGVFGTFRRITFPLLLPVIATVGILDSLTAWNDFYTPLLFLQSREKGVILLEVFRNIGQFSTDWTSFFPMLVLGIAPLLLFYLFMQRYIISGIVTGAVKG
ncbi:sugar ABC transporter permease [Paenibacillus ferrarius]|uniref:Sugar ABC transporter permease n=1 Tax=Paenibacillus ferrarius TaxID=1469647 RepID=A0A1V4HB52_9BACL|nr:carbohydrate ABC transporter permease [Paenibacillus ferrarius]OPH49325.1 sugar ABC transporter permease [Paenibacillus ferrarius]